MQTQPLENRTCFEMIATRLDVYGRPYWAEDDTGGRFIACRTGFYDPAVFENNREVTFTGPGVEGYENRRIGQYDYRFPRVAADVVYLWPVRERVNVLPIRRRAVVGLLVTGPCRDPARRDPARRRLPGNAALRGAALAATPFVPARILTSFSINQKRLTSLRLLKTALCASHFSLPVQRKVTKRKHLPRHSTPMGGLLWGFSDQTSLSDQKTAHVHVRRPSGLRGSRLAGFRSDNEATT